MVYQDRFGHGRQKCSCEYCGRHYWEDEQESDGEDFEEEDNCVVDTIHRRPCFFDERKCKFEFPFKVLVKVVPLDECRREKKFCD
jgi:hypothetical protein